MQFGPQWNSLVQHQGYSPLTHNVFLLISEPTDFSEPTTSPLPGCRSHGLSWTCCCFQIQLPVNGAFHLPFQPLSNLWSPEARKSTVALEAPDGRVFSELEFRLREGYCRGKCVPWGEHPKLCSALINPGLCVHRPTLPKTSMRKVRHSSRREQNIREQMSKRESSEKERET